MIRIGERRVSIFDKSSGFVWDVDGNVVFSGKAAIGSGCKISVAKGANLYLGNNVSITAHTTIDCNQEIRLGNDCLLSWDILIMDSDYHHILKNDLVVNPPKPIIIGDHVWVGHGTTILKGVSICDNVVLACRTLVTGSVNSGNSVVGNKECGLRQLNEGIRWEQ